MGDIVWINGQVHAPADASISVYDHGFLYGDSIYETVRTSRGRPFLLERHLSRLRNSATLIELELDRSDERYRQAVDEALLAAGNTESYLRVIVTRGVGDIGYDRLLCTSPNTLIFVRPLPSIRDPQRRRGIRVAIVDVRRNDGRAVSPAIKSGNLLNNILAAYEAQHKGVDEGIMLNGDGEVAEGSMTNIFVVRRGVVETPPADAGILPGITRQFVLEVARAADIPVRESRLLPDDLRGADEVFLTGTTKGILPIISVDNQPVASGEPGPMTRRLLQLFDAAEDRLVSGTAD